MIHIKSLSKFERMFAMKSETVSRFFRAAVLPALLLTPLAAHAQVKPVEIESSKGVKAYLVEDYTLPMVTIRFSMDGGQAQDPKGKEGLVSLMTSTLDEGAGDLDREAFVEALDKAGADISFSAGQDTISGSMRFLTEKQVEATDLLTKAVNAPRFDEVPVERVRGLTIERLRAQSRDPQYLAQIKWQEAFFGDHPYAIPTTEETILRVTRDDLRQAHKKMFARDKLYVGIVGAIDQEGAKRLLDRVFGDLPEKSQLTPVPEVKGKYDQTVHQVYPLPQTSIMLSYPADNSDDPKIELTQALLTQILGGDMNSRLFVEVREKRGLAYGANMGSQFLDHFAGTVVTTATKSESASEALEVIEAEIGRAVKDGVTEAELASAKTYLAGSIPISRFSSSSAIASTLVDIQRDELGIDFFDSRFEPLLNSITREEVNAMGKRLFSTKPAILLIGPENGKS
ncbi:M16 family metallopeptidase [Limoniibacter endophyticus]|uniref:Peptidase M16 n=1 Tax=Limoniibacter endophyticus TaxID=1565040 RepID=A0A8J3DHE1_9HYPH|nr:pitrilysin family protein [Limoniibacter endophyticus]GHC67885.1 peptidase M16 [Limoniibacter endophyticus]